jgi:hypothetical protein
MVSHAVVEAIKEHQAAPYAWIIDIDRTETPGSDMDAMGRSGPRWASDTVLVCLRNDLGYGRRFRMLDGDDEVYYLGRLWDERDKRDIEWFGPLDDFGRPFAGCTAIEYFEDGKWVEV